MQSVNIYLVTSYKGIRESDGYYCCMLEMKTDKGDVTKELIKKVHGSAGRIELTGLLRALKCLVKACEIQIYTDSRIISRAFNDKWIDKWKKVDWVNSKGKPVENMELWKEIDVELSKHIVSVEYTEHTEYYNWQRMEIRRKEQEDG